MLLAGCGTKPLPKPTSAKTPEISIHDAIGKGNSQAVKQHLAAGTKVDVKHDDGWTPLHYAASKGQKEVATLLITEGVDVNAKTTIQNGYGATPIEWAIEEGHTETVDLLRKHGGKTSEELKAEGK